MDGLKEYDDGAGRFGLESGEILQRAVKGERLSSILASSPFARSVSSARWTAYKQAADNPVTVLGDGEDIP